jgi:rubrerythrin
LYITEGVDATGDRCHVAGGAWVIRLLRRFAIDTLLKSRWRNNPESLARTLGKFADVEADSAWHYTIAADFLDQPAHRAVMVLAALEETHHAYLLNRLESRGGGAGRGGISRKRVLGSAADLASFLAYSQIAEGQIHGEFGSIADASGDEEVAAVIRSISSDEGAHETDAAFVLRQLVPEAEFRRSIHRARWKRTFDNWMELIHSIGKVNAALWLSIIYLFLGWIAVPSCRRRLSPARGAHAGPSGQSSSVVRQYGMKS